MQVQVTLTLEDLQSALHGIAPFRYPLSDDGERHVEVRSIRSVRLVANEGLSVIADGRVQWTVAGMALSINIQNAELSMKPTIAKTDAGMALEFEVRLQKLDLELAPNLVDGAIANRINAALADPKNAVAWKYQKVMTVDQSITMLQPTLSFALRTGEAIVEVSNEAVTLSVPLWVAFGREPGEGG